MKRKLVLSTVAAAGLLLSGSAFASNIYKYTDENGNVHYVDRPTGAPSEERVTSIVSARTDNSAVQARAQARLDSQPTREERTAARDAEEQAKLDAHATREQRAKKCEESRARLESYLRSQRLYRQNDSGDREYLNEQEIQAARQKVEDMIKENCS